MERLHNGYVPRKVCSPDDSNSKAQARRISFCKPFCHISHFIFYMACMLGHDTGTSKMHSCDINTGAGRKKRLFPAL